MKSPAPQALVTCGPAFSPIDAVRMLTNVSTGTLGYHLCQALTQRGWKVLCFKGDLATAFPKTPLPSVDLRSFGKNADLLQMLRALPQREAIRVVFHAAALTDFEVSSVTDPNGVALPANKISSEIPELLLRLRPALKLLPELSILFPNALIVGWKFELEGTRKDALDRAAAQIEKNRTSLCVLNGSAFGPGFGILSPEGRLLEVEDRKRLSEWLANWAEHTRHT